MRIDLRVTEHYAGAYATGPWLHLSFNNRFLWDLLSHANITMNKNAVYNCMVISILSARCSVCCCDAQLYNKGCGMHYQK